MFWLTSKLSVVKELYSTVVHPAGSPPTIALESLAFVIPVGSACLSRHKTHFISIILAAAAGILPSCSDIHAFRQVCAVGRL